MYRGFSPRCIFFCRFFEKSREKISFHRLFHRHLFVTPHALRRGDFYYELFRMCTWITQCMRCDQSGGADSRPWGEFFRGKLRPGCPHEVRENPYETARGHRGRRRSEAGEFAPLLPGGSRVDCGVSNSRRGAEAATKSATRKLYTSG